ncbi:phytoene desaturase family protein [Rhodopirellula sp. MGV]|uniref:phytoene desaturase family protein n=1 Tax=Rhodopirellula sp. MGV TaxID=2023130 RepID=UPI000B96162D|nr:phytoene desaturase family protein [Rhodopirellula sp. MGV]OYP35502.1 phytoene desaturase [Rhodopirellula sp. MGV]PNY33943.1 phytoene desaturase [Rhodopirellula baltica]
MIAADSGRKNVIVIGAGLAGLSSACVLAARGHSVTLLDKNDWVGGKAAQHVAEGYRFDMGPTILTVPSVLKRVFEEADRKMEDYVKILPLDPQWRCFFESGGSTPGETSVLDLVPNVEQMKRHLAEFTSGDANGDGYERFIKLSKHLHEVSDRFFFWRSVGGLADTMDVGGAFSLDVLKDVLSLRMGKSVASVVRSHTPDPRVSQMMDHFTQYVGSSPYASPAVLCSIAHMQTDEGIWYPVGGTRAVPEALAKLAEELGVDIRTGVDVMKINTQGKRVTGVVTATGETLPCDAVVSNCDAVRTYRELLRDTPQSKKFERSNKYSPACSGVVLYLGLNRRYEQLLHHNFVFSKDPETEFEYIYDRGEPAPDPTAYVCAPAISEPEVAPEGCEALYILVHTPYLREHHDWKKMLPEYREVILDKMESCAGTKGIRDAIVYEASLTPEGIHNRYRVLNGAIYGLASHGKFTGAFKPGNRRKDLQGLYLAGGAAHPGPGMPMVMMSGWIAADSLDQDARGGKLASRKI